MGLFPIRPVWYNQGEKTKGPSGRLPKARRAERGMNVLNIQIFGKSKCFDTKKAERYFKERRVKFQAVDLVKYGISPGELKSVVNAVGLEALVDPKHPDAPMVAYLAYDGDKLEKLLENPRLLRTPIVRNGKKATVGYCPDVWKDWEA